MLRTATIALSVAMFAAFGSTAFAAHHSMSSSHMSKRDMAMMKKCESMSHSAMMKNRNCMAMMKKHQGMMKSNSMGSKPGSSAAMKNSGH